MNYHLQMMLIFIASLLLLSCGEEKVYRMASDTPLITANGSFEVRTIQNGKKEIFTSTSAGNLAATSLRNVHNLAVSYTHLRAHET